MRERSRSCSTIRESRADLGARSPPGSARRRAARRPARFSIVAWRAAERGAELVGDVGDEVAADAVDVCSSSALMWLNAVARWAAIRRCPRTPTRRPCSPRAIASAAAAISRSGAVVPRASSWTTASARTTAARIAQPRVAPAARPPTETPTATAIATTIRIPIFSFSELSPRSGLTTGPPRARNRRRGPSAGRRRRASTEAGDVDVNRTGAARVERTPETSASNSSRLKTPPGRPAGDRGGRTLSG